MGQRRRLAAVAMGVVVGSMVLVACQDEQPGSAQAGSAPVTAAVSEAEGGTGESSTTTTGTSPVSSSMSAPMSPATSSTVAPSTAPPDLTADPTSEQPPSPPPATTPPPASTTSASPSTLTLTSSAPATDPIACLYDTWTMSNPVFGAVMDEVSGGIATDAVSGAATITFHPDGTFEGRYDNWTHELEAAEGAMTIVRNGVDTGTFVATEDGTLTITEEVMSSTISMTIETPGGKMAVNPGPSDPQTSTATYDCEAGSDIMTVVQDGQTMVLGRGSVLE